MKIKIPALRQMIKEAIGDEEARPIGTERTGFEELVSRFNTMTDLRGRDLPFYADVASVGVESPYVYILDHNRKDPDTGYPKVIAFFRTPEKFQKVLKDAEAEAERILELILDYGMEFGEQLKVWSDD